MVERLEALARQLAADPMLGPLAESLREAAEAGAEPGREALDQALGTDDPDRRLDALREAEEQLAAAARDLDGLNQRLEEQARAAAARAELAGLADREDALGDETAGLAPDPAPPAALATMAAVAEAQAAASEAGSMAAALPNAVAAAGAQAIATEAAARVDPVAAAAEVVLPAGAVAEAQAAAAEAGSMAAALPGAVAAAEARELIAEAAADAAARGVADALAAAVEPAAAAVPIGPEALPRLREEQGQLADALRGLLDRTPLLAGEEATAEALGLAEFARHQLDRAGDPAQADRASRAASRAMREAAAALREAAGPADPSARAALLADRLAAAPTAARPSLNFEPDGSPVSKGEAEPSDPRRALGLRDDRDWGELPGHLRTEILQAPSDRYREAYARLIRLYYRDIARAPRASRERPNDPASNSPLTSGGGSVSDFGRSA